MRASCVLRFTGLLCTVLLQSFIAKALENLTKRTIVCNTQSCISLPKMLHLNIVDLFIAV